MVHYAHSFPHDFSAPRAPRFEVHADRCPQVLPRILDLFARLGLLPVDVRARRSCGGLWVGLHVEIDAAAAERAAERLRATVGIQAVVLVHAATPERTHQPDASARFVAAWRDEAPSGATAPAALAEV